jgi:hypothetical protein
MLPDNHDIYSNLGEIVSVVAQAVSFLHLRRCSRPGGSPPSVGSTRRFERLEVTLSIHLATSMDICFCFSHI